MDLGAYVQIDKLDKIAKRNGWERIHGWKRRTLKTYIHNTKVAYKKQQDMFNKYVGRPDVLYIHARIGGGNWPYYFDKVVNQRWFLEKVDDAFDSTYCDIYAKIEPTKKKARTNNDRNYQKGNKTNSNV